MSRSWNNANSWNVALRWNGQPMVTTFSKVRDHRRVIVEIVKGLATLRYSDGEYVDQANLLVLDARLSRTVTFERRISTAFWTSSGRNFTSVGNIELINCDGKLDNLIQSDLKDAEVRIRVGSTLTPYSEFLIVARGILDKVEAVGEDKIRLIVADGAREFDRAVQVVKPASGPLTSDHYPVALGWCSQVPVMHTGSPDLRYSLSDIPVAVNNGSVSNIRDSGVALTVSTQYNTIDTDPNFGFELYQSTAGKLTATTIGPSVAGSVFESGRFLNQIIYLLQNRFGLPAIRADAGGYEAIRASNPNFIGRYIFDGSTYSRILDEYADSIGGWWHVDLGGRVKIERLNLPSLTLPPDITVSKINLVGEIQVDPDLAPGLSNALLGGPQWAPLSESEQATSVRDTDDGRLQRKLYRWRVEFAVHSSYQRNIDSLGNIRDSNPDERQTGMPTLWVSTSGLAIERVHRESLWASPKAFFRCKVNLNPAAVASLDIGSIVNFDLPRYGLTNHRATLIGLRGEAGKNEVELYAWGELPPPTSESGGGSKE